MHNKECWTTIYTAWRAEVTLPADQKAAMSVFSMRQELLGGLKCLAESQGLQTTVEDVGSALHLKILTCGHP